MGSNLLDPTCIFCQIISGESEASVVYQDELVTAFMDLYPVTPGHTLIIPNQHEELITGVKQEAIQQIFAVGVQIDQALRLSDLRCEAVSFYLADGVAAGQVVPHAHLHVIPRYSGDSSGIRLHSGRVQRASRESLDDQARLIQSSMKIGA
jgi:diadenosine tetraphosphate (Ap4A) HIT family hydrolase